MQDREERRKNRSEEEFRAKKKKEKKKRLELLELIYIVDKKEKRSLIKKRERPLGPNEIEMDENSKEGYQTAREASKKTK